MPEFRQSYSRENGSNDLYETLHRPRVAPRPTFGHGVDPPKIAVSQRRGVKNGVKIFRARQFFENFFGGQKKYKNKVFDIFDPKIAPDDVIGVI